MQRYLLVLLICGVLADVALYYRFAARRRHLEAEGNSRGAQRDEPGFVGYLIGFIFGSAMLVMLVFFILYLLFKRLRKRMQQNGL